jgi:hypothetical protein
MRSPGIRRAEPRFDVMHQTWRAELGRVEGVLDARLKALERSHEAPSGVV